MNALTVAICVLGSMTTLYAAVAYFRARRIRDEITDILTRLTLGCLAGTLTFAALCFAYEYVWPLFLDRDERAAMLLIGFGLGYFFRAVVLDFVKGPINDTR